MREREFTFAGADGTALHAYEWLPDRTDDIRGVVQVAHGMCETAARYRRFATALTDAGYAVWANDHRGHGRSVEHPSHLGDLGPDGYQSLVRDIKSLTELATDAHPGRPVFLFGHSMGSFLARSYLAEHAVGLSGVILSGTGYPARSLLRAAAHLARREIRKHGPRARSALLTRLTFGSYNRRFRPNRTAFDWLSRDSAEVDLYVSDPLCGTPFTNESYLHFFEGLRAALHPRALASVRRDLPILFISGSDDPVGQYGAGVRKAERELRRLGFQNVTCRLYEGGRHEMLNEVNREEVMRDISEWLRAHE